MWVEAKTIRGRPYLYLRWRENGTQRSKYLGPARHISPGRATPGEIATLGHDLVPSIIERLQAELQGMRARRCVEHYALAALIREIREHYPGSAP